MKFDLSVVGHLRKAVLGRFLPACGAVMLSVLALMGLTDPGDLRWIAVGLGIAEVTLMTLGFGTVLTMARERLPTMPRLGLRSAAAGLLTPLVLLLMSGIAQGASTPTIVILTLTAGVVTGAGLTLSGLRRTTSPGANDPAVAAAMKLLEDELRAPRLPGDRLDVPLAQLGEKTPERVPRA